MGPTFLRFKQAMPKALSQISQADLFLFTDIFTFNGAGVPILVAQTSLP